MIDGVPLMPRSAGRPVAFSKLLLLPVEGVAFYAGGASSPRKSPAAAAGAVGAAAAAAAAAAA